MIVEKLRYIAIDLHDLRQSVILRTLTEVAEVTRVSKNTLTKRVEGVHGHYLIVPYTSK